MATIAPKIVRLSDDRVRVTWTGLTNGDVGQSVSNVYDPCSVQVGGTFGAGGSATLQGSNDAGVTFDTLTDRQGIDLVITQAGIKSVTEFVEHIRPEVFGDDTTSLTVVLWMAKG